MCIRTCFIIGGDSLSELWTAGHGVKFLPVARDTLDDRLRGRSIEPMGPQAAILQAGQAFPIDAIDPLGAPGERKRLRLH
jgi:hypothetical protein